MMYVPVVELLKPELLSQVSPFLMSSRSFSGSPKILRLLCAPQVSFVNSIPFVQTRFVDEALEEKSENSAYGTIYQKVKWRFPTP